MTSSLNVGFHTEQQLNEKLSFNVQQQLKNTLNHAILSFNTKQYKYVLFDNFNVLVLLKKILLHIFYSMEPHFWMLKLCYNKHVLLVWSKILYVHKLISCFPIDDLISL